MTTIAGNLAKAHRLLAPRVAYLIGTRDAGGEANLIPVSNVTSVSTAPELVVVSVFTEWQTYHNLRATAEFTISVPRAGQVDGVWKLGARYSRFTFADRTAKLAASGLAILDDGGLPGPVLTDGLGWFVCRIAHRVDVPSDHGIFVAEITHVEFDADSFDRDGNPGGGLDPLMQVTGNLFTTAGERFSVDYGTD